MNMLTDNNSIILVDDRAEDLSRLSSVFNQRGIGCRSFTYDGIDFPNKPLEGVRMVFMDINLSNSGDKNSQFAVLAEALCKYVSKDNSLFVLVFWTTHVNYIEEFKEFVNRDAVAEEVPKPIRVFPLDKNQFVDNSIGLEEKLSSLFDEELVKCLFSFDKDIQKAANRCLTNIVNLVSFDDKWGDNTLFETSVRNLFTKIAVDFYGVKPAKANPDKAIKEVIAPSFLYDLAEIKQNTWKDFLQMDAKSDGELMAISFPTAEVPAKLNTILNIDPSTDDAEARGSIRMMKMDEEAKECFQNSFAVSTEDFIKTKMVSVKDDKFVDEATIIAVEISAACDFSNNKPRLHRYMLGIICKRSDFDDLVSKGKTKQKGEHIFQVPFDFIYKDEVYCMVLNLNYTFSEESTDKYGKIGTKIFGLKSEFMNSISEHYAQHISRIGFARF